MRIPSISLALLGFLVAGCASDRPGDATADAERVETVRIEKVIPFATADAVRMQVRLAAGSRVRGIELRARITPRCGSDVLWQGSAGTIDIPGNAKANATAIAEHTVVNLKPLVWEPTAPHLYELVVTASRNGTALATSTTRFGFRSFQTSPDGQFLLNGRPIFLRGIAINPPGRGIPPQVGQTRKFAQDYVRYMKSRGVNLIRLEPENQDWFDVCDEEGMMVFQGAYGSPPIKPGDRASTKQEPPEDFESSMAGYRAIFENYPQHPSIVIYIMSNELPYQGTRGQQWHEYLVKAHAALKRWSPETVFIGNAGYGEGREGDVNDVHRYWGWYYNSFLTYFNLRDTRAIFGDPEKVQPVTFTECVGNYTGVNGAYNIVVSKQLGAQLGWTGHSANQSADALNHQKLVTKQATELFRRLRPQNPRLAGLMPFSIFFYHWKGITSFDQMKPKPAMEQLGMSYAPVLLSWEMWTPQVYAGTTLKGFAHVVNDADDGGELRGAKLKYELITKDTKDTKGTKKLVEGDVNVPEVPYFGVWNTPFEIELPNDAPEGEYTLVGRITIDDKTITTNTCDLFIASDAWKKPQRRPETKITLYDPIGKTAQALSALTIPFEVVGEPASAGGSCLVIGERAWDDKLSGDALNKFIAQGGRILLLGQEPDVFKHDWLPAKIQPFTVSANDPTYVPKARPSRDQQNINPQRPWHPVFLGLTRYRLSLWSDYTSWDQTRRGFPQLYPVKYGFKLTDAKDLARTAILANYDRGLEGVALAEMFHGKGSVLLSAFDLVDRIGLDPAADRLLANLVAYVASDDGRELHPLIDQPIRWGDYPSERGVITGPLNGLVVNAVWLKPPTDPNATPLPDNTGAWNTDPGNQFVPRGRRPLGPYRYSNASSLLDQVKESPTGSGMFYARLPAGRGSMVTTVRNNGDKPAVLHVDINGAPAGAPAAVAPGETVTVRSPLPPAATEVAVKYAGEKTLVLEETRFE